MLCFGNFTTEAKWVAEAIARELPQTFPASPGVFALQHPYEMTVCVIADNCPARYVNDAKDITDASPNIVFVQHEHPRELYHDPLKGMHLFLQAQATKDIEAGEQLFLSYGEMFWEEHAPINATHYDLEELYEPAHDEVDRADVDEDEDDGKRKEAKSSLQNASNDEEDRPFSEITGAKKKFSVPIEVSSSPAPSLGGEFDLTMFDSPSSTVTHK